MERKHFYGNGTNSFFDIKYILFLNYKNVKVRKGQFTYILHIKDTILDKCKIATF